MPIKLIALEDVHLLPETQRAMSELMGYTIEFPADHDTPQAELIRRAKDADAVLVSPGTTITRAFIEANPQLKYIGVCGTSLARIDQAAVKERGITLTNVRDYGDEPTAEFIFMQLVRLARGIGEYQWRAQAAELMGKRITIVGIGALGRAIAHLALAYKMQVSYYSTHRKPELESAGARYGELDALLQQSEILITSVPSDTVVLEQAQFDLLPPGVIFAQASMGSTFNHDAFAKWIARDGNFAIFDMATGRDMHDRYAKTPQVVFAEVTAGYTLETKQRLGQKVIENLTAFVKNPA